VFAGTILSAALILMANSWMQHPVGYQMVHGQPQLTNIWTLMTNPVFLWGYTHVVLDSIVTGAVVMTLVSLWFLMFPGWYATMFSGFYLALLVLLGALMVRGTSFEYRGKRDRPAWRDSWTGHVHRAENHGRVARPGGPAGPQPQPDRHPPSTTAHHRVTRRR
jgi:hypothetical protein